MNTNAVYVLVGRLNTGWIVCERETDPVKRAQLEDYWIALLHQYEVLCDQSSTVTERMGVAA